MKVTQFLDHHGLSQNPFNQEDAQTDPLFKQFCARETFHPAWDKICGEPGDPATSVVFGEKGSGKTALRLQMIDRIAGHNRDHAEQRVYVIEYDDFNPFLDAFHQRMSVINRSPHRTLARWRLWDHMDAILSLAITRLGDDLLDEQTSDVGPFEIHAEKLSVLTHSQKRDFLMLTAFYDRSLGLAPQQRWDRLRRKLRYANLRSWWELAVGAVVTPTLFGIMAQAGSLNQFGRLWPWLILLVAWGPWLWKQLHLTWKAWWVARAVRVLDRPLNALRGMLSSFDGRDLISQPFPSRDRSDDRYELLGKLQSILRTLGFPTITIVVDRVDEPHLVNGNPERMRELLWPMFDNKFLKHAGLGFKLLLPSEVSLYLDREDKEFYERSRLDKQNLIRSLEWTGESLYDLANDRIRASSRERSAAESLKGWFEESVSEVELIGTLSRLRVPRHLFKFLHRLLVDHCHRYTDENPRWTIGRETLQSTLAVYLRDLDAYDRGLGTG